MSYSVVTFTVYPCVDGEMGSPLNGACKRTHPTIQSPSLFSTGYSLSPSPPAPKAPSLPSAGQRCCALHPKRIPRRSHQRVSGDPFRDLCFSSAKTQSSATAHPNTNPIRRLLIPLYQYPRQGYQPRSSEYFPRRSIHERGKTCPLGGIGRILSRSNR
jgi:hypothetical protein